MTELTPKILGNIDASDAAPALQQILMAVDATTILAITDAQGIILHVNELFCEISKFSRDELVGQTHRIVRSEYHDRSFFVELWRTISSGKTWSGEIKNRAKDGSHYWVETSIVPFLDDQGKPYQYVAIRKDVTDKKLLDEQVELERAKSLHSEKMAALGEMAAGIAHEVGNPLGAIRGRAEMLCMRAESGEVSGNDVVNASRKILSLVDRTSKIIKGLKAYSRDASNDPMEKINICETVDGILDFSKPRLERYSIDLSKEYLSKDLVALCRESEIGQVLVNLVNNACDALKGEQERKVTIRVGQAAEDVFVEVENSGTPINRDVRERMFEPFFTTKSAGSGTGLGLSISRRIMDSHGGELILKEDGPTCFVMRWPIN